MNETWNTLNMNAPFPRGKSSDEVSMNDINSLLKGRSYNQDPVQHNSEDIRELQEFCQRHGILGVNFGNRNPKAILNMLKARVGERNEPVSKKGIIYG